MAHEIVPLPPMTKAERQEFEDGVRRRRERLDLKKLLAKLKKKFPRVQTRGTFNWKESQGKTTRVVPTNFDDVGEAAHYVARGHPGGEWDIVPVIRESQMQRYAVFRQPRGGEKERMGVFRRCCEGDGPFPDGIKRRYCRRKTCANCWTTQNMRGKRVEWSIEMLPYRGDPRNLHDVGETHPHGKRSQGKSLDEETQQTYAMTSSQTRHKGRKQRQHDPADVKRWREQEK